MYVVLPIAPSYRPSTHAEFWACRQRVRMPVDAKSSDVPHVPDDESWYRYVSYIPLFAARC